MARRRSPYSSQKPKNIAGTSKTASSGLPGTADDSLRNRPAPLAEAGLDHGMSQVSIVETALSPLDYHPGSSLRHTTEFHYFTKDRRKHTGSVTVTAPDGLSPTDELILYGLMAITFVDRNPVLELTATPHFLCRQLGLPIGGTHYKRLRESISRLSTVHYRNTAWWDRQRGQHRDVGFHFLSYDLSTETKPTDRSREPWTLIWDPLFFRLMLQSQGFIWFDFQSYRKLKQPAARRGFLLLQKIFHHRDTTPKFDLKAFATNQLGYSPSLELKSIRQKIKRIIQNWQELGVVDENADPEQFFDQTGPGQWTICLRRGSRFANPQALRPWTRVNKAEEHPAYELLQQLGLPDHEIQEIFINNQERMIYVIRAALLSRNVSQTEKSGTNDRRQSFFEILNRTNDQFHEDQEKAWLAKEIYELRRKEASEQWDASHQPETIEKSKPKSDVKETNTKLSQSLFHFPPFQDWLTGNYE